jgi:polyisoprenoid-binding protein YceI
MRYAIRIRTALGGALLLAGLAAAAGEFQIDASHSEILFKVRHMGINTVTGRFDSFQGSFTLDPKKIEATTGMATIETKSVNTNNQKRDDHLRGDDFFNAGKFPQLKFKSKAVRKVNMKDSTCELVGDLTIRDVTKEIVLKVKGGGLIQDPWGNERAGFTATGKLNRFDYGLKWNNLLETGGFVVGPEVELALTFEGVRPLAAAGEKKAAAPAEKKAAAPAKPAMNESQEKVRKSGGY